MYLDAQGEKAKIRTGKSLMRNKFAFDINFIENNFKRFTVAVIISISSDLCEILAWLSNWDIIYPHKNYMNKYGTEWKRLNICSEL